MSEQDINEEISSILTCLEQHRKVLAALKMTLTCFNRKRSRVNQRLLTCSTRLIPDLIRECEGILSDLADNSHENTRWDG